MRLSILYPPIRRFDGWDDPLRQRYPLQLTGFHYKARTHSSYGNIDVLQQACPQEIWINRLMRKHAAFSTATPCGSLTRTERCSFRQKSRRAYCPASPLSAGRRLNADMFGDKIDRGGSINILTSHRPSPLAKGNPSHSNLVQVEKA